MSLQDRKINVSNCKVDSFDVVILASQRAELGTGRESVDCTVQMESDLTFASGDTPLQTGSPEMYVYVT